MQRKVKWLWFILQTNQLLSAFLCIPCHPPASKPLNSSINTIIAANFISVERMGDPLGRKRNTIEFPKLEQAKSYKLPRKKNECAFPEGVAVQDGQEDFHFLLCWLEVFHSLNKEEEV